MFLLSLLLCVYVSVRVYTCMSDMCVCPGAGMWRSEVNFRCCPLGTLSMIFGLALSNLARLASEAYSSHLGLSSAGITYTRDCPLEKQSKAQVCVLRSDPHACHIVSSLASCYFWDRFSVGRLGRAASHLWELCASLQSAGLQAFTRFDV